MSNFNSFLNQAYSRTSIPFPVEASDPYIQSLKTYVTNSHMHHSYIGKLLQSLLFVCEQ